MAKSENKNENDYETNANIRKQRISIQKRRKQRNIYISFLKKLKLCRGSFNLRLTNLLVIFFSEDKSASLKKFLSNLLSEKRKLAKFLLTK